MKKIFLILASFSLLALSGCVVFHGYQPVIQQGNIITAASVAKLKRGMTPTQVQVIMGTPVLTNTFRNNEWDYVYTRYKGGKNLHEQRVLVHFKNGRVSGISKS